MSEQNELRVLSDSQKKVLEEATAEYQFELAMDPEALEYLASRGLSPETIVGARLGLISDTPWPGHYGRTGWLSIPYLDKDGHPLTMRFRCLQQHKHEGHGKYMSIAEDPARTYNVGAIHAAVRGVGGDHSIHICEGELDALVLHQMGLHAIAIPGASGWQPKHRVMLAGFNEVYAIGDGDDAGDMFNRKITKSMRNAVIVRIPRGMDVGNVYTTGGEAALRELLEEAKA